MDGQEAGGQARTRGGWVSRNKRWVGEQGQGVGCSFSEGGHEMAVGGKSK